MGHAPAWVQEGNQHVDLEAIRLQQERMTKSYADFKERAMEIDPRSLQERVHKNLSSVPKIPKSMRQAHKVKARTAAFSGALTGGVSGAFSGAGRGGGLGPSARKRRGGGLGG